MQRTLSPSNSLDIEVDRFYTHLERGMTIELISTFEGLRDCQVDDELHAVITAAEVQPFDHLPVRANGSYVGLLPRAVLGRRLEAKENLPESVSDAMQPLSESNLIATEASILDFVAAAQESPARLVIKGTRIAGIVTVSDLHKLPVRTALLVLVTHFELQLTEYLRVRYRTDEVFSSLASDRRVLVERRWTRLRDSSRDIDQFGALDLRDKHDLFVAAPGVLADSDWDVAVAAREFEAIYRLRNSLAHARDYALTDLDVQNLVNAVRSLRAWIERLRGDRVGDHPSSGVVQWSLKGSSP